MCLCARGQVDGKSRKQREGYAKLEGPRISRVLQTVCMTLGRDGGAAERKAAGDPSSEEAQRERRREKSFVGVGEHPSISRRHAEIVFDFRKRRWALLSLSRNGVVVNDEFVAQVLPRPSLVQEARHPLPPKPVTITRRARPGPRGWVVCSSLSTASACAWLQGLACACSAATPSYLLPFSISACLTLNPKP